MNNFIEDIDLNSLIENSRKNLLHNLEKWTQSDHVRPDPIITPDDYIIDLKPSIITTDRLSLPKSDLIPANSLSQDRINSLLAGYSWTLPTSKILTYSFYESSVWNGSYYGMETGVTEVSEAVKTNVRQILNWLETVIDIDFQEVNETSTTAPVGKLRYMLSNGPSYAYAYYPNSSFNEGGDVHLNPSYQNNSSGNGFERTAGNHGYMSLIHETLHGLGLKHPHESPALATVEDNSANTVMSYRFTGNSSGTAMAYDLAALQYLYGTKAKETGDTSYQFTTRIDQFSVNGTLSLNTTYLTKQTIWDTNGNDTLDFSTLAFENLGYRLDMNQGGWLTANRAYRFQQSISDPNVTGGTIQSTYFDFGTLIAYNVILENIINSTSADTIYANDAANAFRGYTIGRSVGADILWNTNSNDTLDLSAYSFNAVTRTQNGNDLVLGLGSNGSITVKNYYISPQLNILYNTITLPTITLEVAPSSVTEDGTGNLIYTFTRTGSTSNNLTINFDVSGNAVFSTDYSQNGAATFNNTNGSIIFNSGANIATLTLSPTDDTELETDEIIGIGLSTNSNYTIGTVSTVTSTILNDEIPVNLPSVTLAVSPTAVAESSTPNLIYTFTRTGDTTNPLTVNFSVNGTASWNSDYITLGGSSFSTTAGSIIFGANTTTATLIIDPKADTIVENNETVGLTLTSSIDYTISTPLTLTSIITNDDGDALDNTLIGGSGKDNLNGKEGNDTLIGDAGNDTLNGGIGVDSLMGGLGNDIYVIDHLNDIFTESAGEGTDTLQTPFTFDLTGTNLENLTLTGTGNIDGTGDGNNNTLTGNAGNNTLSGGNGNDSLVGGNGNDRLFGGNGNDRLTGGGGSDRFVFASLVDKLDRITDFQVVDDTIELSASGFGGGLSVGILDSSLLKVGAGIISANTATQRLIFNTTTGALFFDADGNGTLATATQFAILSANLALTNADFLVV